MTTAAAARARWTSLIGTGAAASGALTALVLCCVFVAVAGPRQSLGLRTRALRSDVATATPLARSVFGVANYTDFDAPIQGLIPAMELTAVRQQVRTQLARSGLPLEPASADWVSMTSALSVVTGSGRGAYNGGAPPKMEVIYNDSLARHVRLVSGHLPDGPLGPQGNRLGIAVTQATAARFGLRIGSLLRTAGRGRLEVTGIMVPLDPGSAFWTADPNAAKPTPPAFRVSENWEAAAFAGPDETDLMQNTLDLFNGQLTWDYPLALSGLNADQAAPLTADLDQARLRDGAVPFGAGSFFVMLGSEIGTSLTAFVQTDAALSVLLSLVYVSLAVIGLIIVLLGARMLAERRRPELSLMRARGASRPQIAWLALAGGAVTAVPAAAAGTVLAVALTPGHPAPQAWWLAAVTLLTALAGPPLIAARWLDTAGPGGADRAAGKRATGLRATRSRAGRIPANRRWVAQGTAILLAAGGLIELHQQGLPAAGSGINVFISAAPVLVAVPAAVIVIWVSPLVLRGLLRAAAARPGVTAFVGLARAARAALAATLPAFALVLALTVVAFGFMVRGAVLRGQVAQSWRVTGADAVVNLVSVPDPVTPAEQRQIAAVPGARQAAVAAVTTAVPDGGKTIAVVLVSPARYAALTAATPFPRIPRQWLRTVAGGGGAAQVLASPAAAGELPHGASVLRTAIGKLPIRIVGQLTATPAVPGTPDFILVPSAAAGHLATAAPTELLITGPAISHPALAAAVRRSAPQAAISYRAGALAALTGAALPHGAYLAFAESSFVAAGFSVLILLLSLVLAARSRALTLARLATMGLGGGQARWLVIVEAMPTVLAAAVAGIACALALLPLLGPDLDLSVFTGSGAAVPVRAGVTALVIPAAGLIVLGVVTLALQVALSGRRQPASSLRING
jgi:putative ABC transport system permease protein